MLLNAAPARGRQPVQPTYLSMREACELSGHSRQWVNTRVARGIITRHMLPGVQYPMYRKDEVEHAMKLTLAESVVPPPKSTLPEYYKIPYVAKCLDVTRAYVWQFIHAGEIPAINVSGKVGRGAVWRIRKEDAEKFIASRQTNVQSKEKES